MGLWATARWSLQQRGLVGTLRAALLRLLRKFHAAHAEPVHPFDRLHGTDTGGLISGGELAVGSPSDQHIVAYAGVPPSRLTGALDRWLAALPAQDVSTYTFVDIGCGKGRALLLASQYAFRNVIGLEINPALATVARANVSKWSGTHAKHAPIQVLTGDATSFSLPAGNCFVFLYNPFGPSVMRTVLRAFEQQQAACRHALYLLYQNETDATPLRDDPRLQRVWTASLPLSQQDGEADPVASPQDITSLYHWVNPSADPA